MNYRDEFLRSINWPTSGTVVYEERWRESMAEEKKMDLRKVHRELEELDKLERRLRGLVSPDVKLLQMIAERRAVLLKA